MREISTPNWSKEFDPRQEIIKDCGPFYLIAKPIRLSKPGRDLTALALRDSQFEKFNNLEDVYLMTTYKEGTQPAGFHYHEEKLELVYPLGDLEFYFYQIQTKETIGIVVPERINDTRFGLFIKLKVAHTIRNPSAHQDVPYIVLSNMREEDAELKNDIKKFEFELPTLQPLENFL